MVYKTLKNYKVKKY